MDHTNHILLLLFATCYDLYSCDIFFESVLVKVFKYITHQVCKGRKDSLFPQILNVLNYLSAPHRRRTLTPAQSAPSMGPCFDICKTRLFNQILNFIQIGEETDGRLSPVPEQSDLPCHASLFASQEK